MHRNYNRILPDIWKSSQLNGSIKKYSKSNRYCGCDSFKDERCNRVWSRSFIARNRIYSLSHILRGDHDSLESCLCTRDLFRERRIVVTYVSNTNKKVIQQIRLTLIIIRKEGAVPILGLKCSQTMCGLLSTNQHLNGPGNSVYRQ